MDDHLFGESAASQPSCDLFTRWRAKWRIRTQVGDLFARGRATIETRPTVRTVTDEGDHDSGADRQCHSGSTFDDSTDGLVSEHGGQGRRPVAVDVREVAVADRHGIDGDSNLVVLRWFEDDVFDRERFARGATHCGPNANTIPCHASDRSPHDHDLVPESQRVWRASSTPACDHGAVSRPTLSLPVVILLVGAVSIGCRDQDRREQVPPPTTSAESAIASPTDPPATMPPTSTAEKVIPEGGTPPTESVYLEVDADGELPVLASTVVGSPVRIIVTSSIERGFRLTSDGTELTGKAVAFQFVADEVQLYEIVDAVSGDLIVSLESILD